MWCHSSEGWNPVLSDMQNRKLKNIIETCLFISLIIYADCTIADCALAAKQDNVLFSASHRVESLQTSSNGNYILSAADQLFDRGSYHEAITEYKRFIFFNPESNQISHALYNMGMAYRASHDWQNAIDSIESSILHEREKIAAERKRIVLGTTLIASGNYSLARLELVKVLEFTSSPLLRRKSIYFNGIASLYMYDWDSAMRSFNDFYSEYDDQVVKERASEIQSLLARAGNSYKSARTAQILSAIIPGAGQIYAGYWKDGINAFILNGLIIGFIANAIYRKDVRDVSIIIFLYRYYAGNIYNAREDVRKHGASMDRENARRIVELVSTDEPLNVDLR